jgi:hypothetical protein
MVSIQSTIQTGRQYGQDSGHYDSVGSDHSADSIIG